MNVPSIAERSRHLKLAADRLSEGMRSGSFRSAFRGQGMEFDGVREYERGDDVRSIDRNVTARSGKPFVRIYREEREFTVFLVVDDSVSMRDGAKAHHKRDKALEAAALLAFAAVRIACPVGSVVFDSGLGKSFPPRAGMSHALALLSDIEGRSSRHGGTALTGALAGAARTLRGRALVFVISDFRCAGYESALAVLARKHDVAALRIVTPLDAALPEAGFVPFRDSESGLLVSLPTSSPAFRARWERDGRESIELWGKVCLRRGARPFTLNTGVDTAVELGRFFSTRRSELT